MAKKIGEVIAMLEKHGWTQVRQSGSHRHFKHLDHARMVTVAGKQSDTISVGQLADIRRKSGIKELR
ncbi:MAG TPA: type II toxin-antitoxin system HicA family toxin [Solirubrobacteraceae bacterium]|jgi:predicted RNA binding protein YcfA (HicA-like mRNA interferase family)|nr:type II toxin-antitoxin system HicA family toxin [Solirubrobacteraceae bacterium]